MRQPTLRQIEAFKAFVENGTVSRAAQQLNISQPAASKLLSHLEEDTGIGLYDRGNGRLNVSERGMQLYDEIDRIFSGMNQILEAIEAIKQEDRKRLMIGVLPAVGSRHIAAAAKIFRQEHPNVDLNFSFRGSQFVVDGVLARRFDLGIVTKATDHPNIEMTILDNRPMVCVLEETHPLAREEHITIEMLCQHPMINFAPGIPTRILIERAAAALGLSTMSSIEASFAPTVCECVASGMGISVMAPLFVDTRLPGLITRPLTVDLPQPVYIARPRYTRRTKLVDAFAGVFKDICLGP